MPVTTDPKFPDPTRLVSHATALRFVRHRLNNFAYGQLKPWAAAHHFTYPRLVAIKSEDKEVQVVLLQRLLAVFGYPAELLRVIVHKSRRHFYQFQSAEVLEQFSAELRVYDQVATDTSLPE